MDWTSIGNAIWDFCVTNGVKVLNALLVFIFGYILIKIVNIVVKKFLSKTKINKVTQSFSISILGFALKLILILAVLNTLGIQTTGLIALLSAAGLAISLSLQNSLANLANGVVIITTQPFEVGDRVRVNNLEGIVKSIGMLTSTIVTTNNEEITLPNSEIVNNPIINYSRFKTRRIVLDFNIAYEADLQLTKKIILDVANSDGRTLTTPAPSVAVSELGDDFIRLTAYIWVDTEDYYDVIDYIKEAVVNEFKRNSIPRSHKQYGIKIQDTEPAPIYDDTPLQPRVEKVRTNRENENFFDKLEDKAKEYESRRKKRLEERRQKRQKKKLQKNNSQDNTTLEQNISNKQIENQDVNDNNNNKN